jgi:hypothetical protein
MTITMQLNEQFCLILSLDRLVMYSVLSYTTHWIRHGSTRIRLVKGGIPELSVPARFYCRDPPLFFFEPVEAGCFVRFVILLMRFTVFFSTLPPTHQVRPACLGRNRKGLLSKVRHQQSSSSNYGFLFRPQCDFFRSQSERAPQKSAHQTIDSS